MRSAHEDKSTNLRALQGDLDHHRQRRGRIGLSESLRLQTPRGIRSLVPDEAESKESIAKKSLMLTTLIEKLKRPGLLGIMGSNAERDFRKALANYFQILGRQIAGLKLEALVATTDKAMARHAVEMRLSNTLRTLTPVLRATLEVGLAHGMLKADKNHHFAEADSTDPNYPDSPPMLTGEEAALWASVHAGEHQREQRGQLADAGDPEQGSHAEGSLHGRQRHRDRQHLSEFRRTDPDDVGHRHRYRRHNRGNTGRLRHLLAMNPTLDPYVLFLLALALLSLYCCDSITR
jgi:hypothetical protein